MTEPAALYTAEWGEKRTETIVKAADRLWPLVWQYIQPHSVVDLGCGRGEWLMTAKRYNVGDVLGIDGPWTKPLLDEHEFIHADLEVEFPPLTRTYDLAICIEVAEHLSAKRADALVDWLSAAAPVILFSCAIPRQGGHGHVNESWLSTWAKRFAKNGVFFYDLLRPKIWSAPDIPLWYRQNLIFAARPSHPIAASAKPADVNFLDLVHPEVWGR